MSAAAAVIQSSTPSEIDVLEPASWQDWPALAQRSRERHPLARARGDDFWLVLRHVDVLRLLGDARLAGGYATIADGAAGRLMGGLLANQTGERHARLRRLVAHAFTPRQIERARLRMRDRVAEALAALPRGEVVDLQASLADGLARRAICDALGLAEREVRDFSARLGTVAGGLRLTASPAQREAAEAAAAAIFALLAEAVARRRREPGDTLLDALAAAEVRPSADLETILASLLVGSIDTVRSFLGILGWLLLRFPETLERLRTAPGLAAPTVEEALRFEPPLVGLPRVAVDPIALGGVEIRAGERVMLDIVSANRDPRRFPEPERFEPLRDASAHLAFGRGTHFCVGAALARMEAQELVLGLAAAEAPRLTLAEPPRWVPFSPARRLEALRVEVG